MKLCEAARVIRSKNAGPFLLTFDVFFANSELFDRAYEKQLFNAASAARAFKVQPSEILGFKYFRFANAVKFSMRRSIASGGPADSDVYGAQQHAPLLDLEAF